MPGTPDPVLGSDALTLAVAAAAGLLVAALPVALRDGLPAPGALALGGGLAYALVCLAAWAGARYAADAFAGALVEDSGRLIAVLALAGLVLGAQAAVPLYAYARWGYLAPLAGLFAATTLVVYLFLMVRGESDPAGLYGLFFGPVLVAGTGLLAVLEAGVRRFVVPWMA